MRFQNRYVRGIKPYQTSSPKAWEYRDKSSVLKLDWNESTRPPSPRVIDALSHSLRRAQLNWYPELVNPRLLGALSRYLGVPGKQIQYFASSDDLHEYVARAFCDTADRITIVSPTYDNFRALAESLGLRVGYFELKAPFTFDECAFLSHLKARRPRLVYLCNPNNPTGTEYGSAMVERLLRAAPDTFFIVDEAYYEFSSGTCVRLAARHDNILITRTFSKAFSLASFRIGYAVSAPENIATLNKIRNPKSVSTLSQVAALAALGDVSYMRRCAADVLRAKSSFLAELRGLGIECYAGGGNFVLARAEAKVKSGLLARLEKERIFVRDFDHLAGMSDYFRITIGTTVEMRRVLGAIRSALRR